MIAEVEFPDEAAADSFEKVDWLGEEVTGEGAYLNLDAGHRRDPAVSPFRIKRVSVAARFERYWEAGGS